jgi:phage regulator Rha-like protein
MGKAKQTGVVSVEQISQSILVFRGHKVLLDEDLAVLRSQSVTSKLQHGGRRYTPYVFTEQGVAMLSSVLNSERAITINIEIMRAFVKLRDLLSSNRELARRFAQLETRLDKKLTEHDEAIAAILSAIRQLMGKSSTH